MPCVLVGLKAKVSAFLPAPDAAALLRATFWSSVGFAIYCKLSDQQDAVWGFVCAFKTNVESDCALELLAGRVVVDVILHQVCQMSLC